MTAWTAALPGSVRLALALLLVILLPAGFVGLCAFALKQAVSAARFAPFLNIFTVGLTLCLLVLLALRHSLIVLVWCLVAAAVLALVPLALDYAVRRGNNLHVPSPLPLPIRVAAVLFVPVFFLWLNYVEDTLHVALPHIYVLPPR
jgi:hypothetical protein